MTEEQLKPWGTILEGKPGLSSTRMAEILKITPRLVKKLVTPCGVMKIPYYNPFDVYDIGLLNSLQNHPEVLKGRIRKEKCKNRDYTKTIEKRKRKCIDRISEKRPELYPLYKAIVNKLWNPATEKYIFKYELYNEFPSVLWDALLPKKDFEETAIIIITDILWAMTKTHTWKVNEDKEQDEPLSLIIYQYNISIKNDPESYQSMFAAAIRHLKYNDEDLPKWGRREKALIELETISNRNWEKELEPQHKLKLEKLALEKEKREKMEEEFEEKMRKYMAGYNYLRGLIEENLVIDKSKKGINLLTITEPKPPHKPPQTLEQFTMELLPKITNVFKLQVLAINKGLNTRSEDQTDAVHIVSEKVKEFYADEIAQVEQCILKARYKDR